MALSSPGVEVKVIDESFYTPAAPGTVPLVIVASAENKANSGATGTAPGTLKANAGEVYLLTSQRDLGDTFGDPIFKTDASNNPVHAGEQNEYGLQAAYSLLGVSNRAFVVRADLDLAQLDASATEPDATPANGTHWLDTQITAFGIFEWNGASAITTGGQKFTNKIPRVITDSTQVEDVDGGPAPASSIGSIGDYAVVMTDVDPDTPALTTSVPGTVWYKSRGVAPGQTPGQWVKVGSDEWFKAWPTIVGTAVNPTTNAANSITITAAGQTSGEIVFGANLQEFVTNINNVMDGTGISAARVNGKLEIYCDGTVGNELVDTATSNAILIEADNTEPNTTPLVAATAASSVLGIKTGTYYAPRLQITPHTQPPQYKSTATAPRPTGSVWLKTTEPNLGARFRVKRWNETTLAWESVNSPVYLNGHEATYNLDRAGGGVNLAVGQLYVQANYTEQSGTDGTPRIAEWKVWRRSGTSAMTQIRSAARPNGVGTGTVSRTIKIAESVLGSTVLGDYEGDGTYSNKTVTWSTTGTSVDATNLAAAINNANFSNIEASVDSQFRVTISHRLGGEFRIINGSVKGDGSNPLSLYGFAAYDYEPGASNEGNTEYLQTAPTGDLLHEFVASNWVPLVYSASGDAPSRIPEDGRLWYSSVIDEVDIMIHDGDNWVGYKNFNDYTGTDPAGPIVSATAPETQSDGTALVTGDLWVSTADIENFPQIYRFNFDLENVPIAKRWILLDKTDQTSEDGVLFADARYNTSGINSYEKGSIVDLLTSDYLDPDAPDPALYPRGMLLWNLRRSGYNVKSFRRDYIDTAEDNIRFDPANTGGESQADYWPHRWVTASGNQADGSGSFGRKAQRKVVVTALQATVNANQQIRDEDGRIFNLIACPGYPELIGEMISLNYDRGLTAFVVGDTPARLTPDATSLLAWGNNADGALEDNDIGAASFDEYMAMFYPWGFTSDNIGNNIAVPPSHMILRTIALNDQVAYPWFAPAGVRRGGITNATAVGYISNEGEFKSVALNNGQRDTLYETKVNPITFFTGTGLVNYGQKTRARAASALDRINVARLVIYLRRQLSILSKPYIFEPNDKITRDEIKGAVESLLLELVGQRALYDYLVVCDESNNTPNRIDRNELWIDIAIEPVKAVEFIYIPLRLKNTGEIAGL
jgi:hypothetical protein